MFHQVKANPPKLIGGPYRPKGRKKGDLVDDALLGLVEIASWSDAFISWPCRKHRGPKVIILTDELVRALKTESASAISYWWGVSRGTVTRWRQFVGAERATQGTRLLVKEVSEAHPENLRRAQAAAMAPDVRKRAGVSRTGKGHTDEARAKISKAGALKKKPEGWGGPANRWMLEGKKKKGLIR